MSYNLFLDDFRTPDDAYLLRLNPVYMTEHWIIVRNYNEFINYIETHNVPDAVSFDHDLAFEHYQTPNKMGKYPSKLSYDQYTEKTGYDCAKWLINYCIDNKKELPTTILVHSLNVAGSLNIRSLFESYFKSLNF
jgi:hypothetical protein